MSILVVTGALCSCSFGTAPCNLMASSAKKVIGSNMAVATIMDTKAENLATFGMCNSLSNPAVSSATSAALGVLTPQPCSPVILTPWMPGSSTVIIENNPALTNTSKANCAWAGIIQISMPGQETNQLS